MIDYQTMYPWALENLLDETSIYTSHEEIAIYMKSKRLKKCIFGRENDRGLKLVPCREDEPVYCDESSNPDGHFSIFIPLFLRKFSFVYPCITLKKNSLPSSTSTQPSYIQIAGHLFWFFPSFAHILAFFHLWKSSYISLRPSV